MMTTEKEEFKIQNSFPPDTRIWIYQSATILTAQQKSEIETKATFFIDDWTAHGKKLKATIEIFHNLFVVVFADEKQALASGCSIDKSLKFIQSLESELNISLLDRMQVAYLEKDEIKTLHLHKFIEEIKNKMISPDVKVFNNLIQTKDQLLNKWLVLITESWHNNVVTK